MSSASSQCGRRESHDWRRIFCGDSGGGWPAAHHDMLCYRYPPRRHAAMSGVPLVSFCATPSARAQKTAAAIMPLSARHAAAPPHGLRRRRAVKRRGAPRAMPLSFTGIITISASSRPPEAGDMKLAIYRCRLFSTSSYLHATFQPLNTRRTSLRFEVDTIQHFTALTARSHQVYPPITSLIEFHSLPPDEAIVLKCPLCRPSASDAT